MDVDAKKIGTPYMNCWTLQKIPIGAFLRRYQACVYESTGDTYSRAFFRVARAFIIAVCSVMQCKCVALVCLVFYLACLIYFLRSAFYASNCASCNMVRIYNSSPNFNTSSKKETRNNFCMRALADFPIARTASVGLENRGTDFEANLRAAGLLPV